MSLGLGHGEILSGSLVDAIKKMKTEMLQRLVRSSPGAKREEILASGLGVWMMRWIICSEQFLKKMTKFDKISFTMAKNLRQKKTNIKFLLKINLL